MTSGRPKVALFANTDWYLYNFRLPLARALRERGASVTLLAPPGPYARRLTAEGFRLIPFAFDRLSLNPARQASAVTRLARIYRRERPDLVHHFTIKCAVYGSLAARVAASPAVVNAFAGLGSVFSEDGSRFRGTRLVVTRTLKFALAGTSVVVQNPEDRARLLDSRTALANQVHLIRGSGVSLDRFKPFDRRPHSRVRVLLASRLLRSKGIATFAEAATRLAATGAEFVIVGAPDAGNPDALSAAELEALAAAGRVTLLGHVEDMPALLASADIVVLPTVYGEGVPRILVEAAAGLPLVATDVPGCREIVRGGQNGFLVHPSDAGALADAIENLIQNRELRAAMGSASRRIAEEFSEPRVIAETLRVYASALAGRDLPPLTPALEQQQSLDVPH